MDEVFTALRKARMQLKPRKCILFARQTDNLGYVISERSVSESPSKISAIRVWPTPENATDVRSFLGAASYYHRFVQDFVAIAAHLHRLTEKEALFVWTSEHQSAFESLKTALSTTPFSNAECAVCTRHGCKSHWHRSCFEPGDRWRGICAWLC